MGRPSTTMGTLELLLALALAAWTPATGAERGDVGESVPCWQRSPPCGGLDPDEPAAGAEGEDAEATPSKIRISRSSGRERPRAAEMAEWRRTYRREIAPVEAALADLTKAKAIVRPASLAPQCRRLARALVDLDRGTLFPAPDLAADVHLKRTLDRLAEAAVACLDLRFAAADYHLAEAERARWDFALALRRYGPWE